MDVGERVIRRDSPDADAADGEVPVRTGSEGYASVFRLVGKHLWLGGAGVATNYGVEGVVAAVAPVALLVRITPGGAR